MAFIIFDNHKFIKDNTTGYYHAHYGNTTKLLHRVVWEYFNGEIPKHYHVHHIDKNKDNNDVSNLELIECRVHLSKHGKLNFEANRSKCLKHLDDIREKAKAWHCSLEGKEWHSKHAKLVAEGISYVTNICEECGAEYEVKAPYSKRSRFCSGRCKTANRKKSGIDDIECICSVCGTIFTKNKYSKKTTCSKECSKRNENKKYN